jgi:hypothetical protein
VGNALIRGCAFQASQAQAISGLPRQPAPPPQWTRRRSCPVNWCAHRTKMHGDPRYGNARQLVAAGASNSPAFRRPAGAGSAGPRLGAVPLSAASEAAEFGPPPKCAFDYVRLLWTARRRFDPSSSPSASTGHASIQNGRMCLENLCFSRVNSDWRNISLENGIELPLREAVLLRTFVPAKNGMVSISAAQIST